MCGNSHYGVPDDVFQASGRHLALSMTSCKQSPARPASLGRWPGGRLFTTLRASVLCSALQTFRALRSMFATLHAGIGVKQTHSYARSLIKTIIALMVALTTLGVIADDSAPFFLNTAKGTRIAKKTELISYSTEWDKGSSVRVTADAQHSRRRSRRRRAMWLGMARRRVKVFIRSHTSLAVKR